MKTKLKIFVLKYLTRIMHALGFYIEKSPNEKTFYKEIKNKEIGVQEFQLKKITSYLRKVNNVKQYATFINAFVPNWEMSFDHIAFCGVGIGGSSLDSFRKVKYKDEWLFEKIYFNRSVDLQRLEWFNNEVFEEIKTLIKIPPIKKLVSGELITLIYFQFIEPLPIPEQLVQTKVIEASKSLYRCSQKPRIQDIINQSPKIIKDYTLHFEYKRCIYKAEQIATERMNDSHFLKDVQSVINESPHILTHGDLHRENIFLNDYLIDWDSFGIYPIGLDVGFLFFRLSLDFEQFSVEQLLFVLEKEYKPMIKEEDWNCFKMNSLFFYFIFTIHHFSKDETNIEQTELLKHIKNLYQFQAK
jgi:hypothetical protein